MAPQTYLGASTPKFSTRLPFCSMAQRLQAYMSLHSTCLSANLLSPAIRWADWRQLKASDNIACLQLPSQSCKMENVSVKISDDNHFKKNQSKQIKTMKQALVQIYSLINRGETFGEMLKRKLETQMNDVSAESLTIDEEFGNDNSKIDWHLALNYFDHCRLVTFGVVRGFLRRVHQQFSCKDCPF